MGNAAGKPFDGVALPYTAGYVKIPDDMHAVSKDWTRQNHIAEAPLSVIKLRALTKSCGAHVVSMRC